MRLAVTLSMLVSVALPAAAQEQPQPSPPQRPAQQQPAPAQPAEKWQRDLRAHVDRMARIAGVGGPRTIRYGDRRTGAPARRHGRSIRYGSLWDPDPGPASVRPLRAPDDWFRRRLYDGYAEGEADRYFGYRGRPWHGRGDRW
jgi:hypothetical protein